MLEDAQKAVPMSATPQPAPQPQAQQAPAPGPEPGTLPWDGPTERPNEPISAGLHPVYGAINKQSSGHKNLAATLEQAAASPNATPRVQMLAEIAKSAVR